jgi:GR25 family glycosyltransferase involved in LPS biosynthesis
MFDKIYIISLRKDKERRKRVSERLLKIGIEYEFFDAYDGSLFNHIWTKLDNPIFTNPNYVACALSHLAVYKDAVENNYGKILILEDDVIPHIDYNNLITSLNIPDKYDLLYLGFIPLTDDLLYWNYNVINDRFIDRNIFYAKNLWGLYAYSPSTDLMKEAIEKYKVGFTMEIDRWFVEVVQKRELSYGICPQLFCHDITISNNTGDIDTTSLLKSIDGRFASQNNYLI